MISLKATERPLVRSWRGRQRPLPTKNNNNPSKHQCMASKVSLAFKKKALKTSFHELVKYRHDYPNLWLGGGDVEDASFASDAVAAFILETSYSLMQ